MSEYDLIKLDTVRKEIQSWLDHNEKTYRNEGILPDDSTHIMSPPIWPSRGVLKNWIKLFDDLETKLKAAERALEDIKKHMEIDAPKLLHLSSVYKLASSALEEIRGEVNGDNRGNS